MACGFTLSLRASAACPPACATAWSNAAVCGETLFLAITAESIKRALMMQAVYFQIIFKKCLTPTLQCGE
jgi:hypothetical protein